tara:strand:- start:589 stop:729 length:141 start_codon:yes stop_codon:yes gene_type:complete
MNFSKTADFTKNGELFVLNYVKNKQEDNNNLVLFDLGCILEHTKQN